MFINVRSHILTIEAIVEQENDDEKNLNSFNSVTEENKNAKMVTRS